MGRIKNDDWSYDKFVCFLCGDLIPPNKYHELDNRDGGDAETRSFFKEMKMVRGFTRPHPRMARDFQPGRYP